MVCVTGLPGFVFVTAKGFYRNDYEGNTDHENWEHPLDTNVEDEPPGAADVHGGLIDRGGCSTADEYRDKRQDRKDVDHSQQTGHDPFLDPTVSFGFLRERFQARGGFLGVFLGFRVSCFKLCVESVVHALDLRELGVKGLHKHLLASEDPRLGGIVDPADLAGDLRG